MMSEGNQFSLNSQRLLLLAPRRVSRGAIEKMQRCDAALYKKSNYFQVLTFCNN